MAGERDTRLDDLSHQLRVLGGMSAEVAVHTAKIDQFDDELEHLRRLLIERADRQDGMLIEIRTMARDTNGRVTALERDHIHDRAVAETAAKIAQQYQTKRAWWPGTITAIVCVLLAALVQILMQLPPG